MLGPLRTAAANPAKKRELPLDHTHEMPAILRLERAGYTAEFVVEDGGTLRASGTGRRYAATDARIRDYYRFEGASDPDDMSVIYAVEMADGTRGVLVDAYGSYSDPAIAAIVARMRIEPLAA